MSPRAACRLDHLGFDQVHDYVAGIADWKAAGLPTEGTAPKVQRVADATRNDVPTCTVDEPVIAARHRTFTAGWEECIVTGCDGIVVGRLRNESWDAEDTEPVEAVMEPGPTTVRPDGLLQPLVDRMKARGTKQVTVTTPQGRLIGVLLRDQAERLIASRAPDQTWQDCEGCPGRWALDQIADPPVPKRT